MKTEIWLSREAWGHEPGSPTILVYPGHPPYPAETKAKVWGIGLGAHLLLPSLTKVAAFRYTVTELPFFWNGSCLSIYHSFWDCPLIKSLQSAAILNHTHTQRHTDRHTWTHTRTHTCTLSVLMKTYYILWKSKLRLLHSVTDDLLSSNVLKETRVLRKSKDKHMKYIHQ